MNFLRIPVASRKPGDTIRTVDISKNQGIKALVAIRAKTKKNVIITYLFSVDKGWDMDKAQEWVSKNATKSIKKDFRFGFEIKEVKGTKKGNFIEGLASTPEVDRDGEIIDPKAFKFAIDEFMKNPVLLSQHNQEKPIGNIVDYKIQKDGFWVKAEVVDEETWKLIKKGVLRAFSWGGRVKGWMEKWLEKLQRMIRVVTQLELYEVSVVSVPANGGALFEISKSLKTVFDSLIEEETDELINKLTLNFMNLKELKALLAKIKNPELKEKLEKAIALFEKREKGEATSEEEKELAKAIRDITQKAEEEDKGKDKEEEKEDDSKDDEEKDDEDKEDGEEEEKEDTDGDGEESDDDGDDNKGDEKDEESEDGADKDSEDGDKDEESEDAESEDTEKAFVLQKAVAKAVLAVLGEVKGIKKSIKDLESKQAKKLGLIAHKFKAEDDEKDEEEKESEQAEKELKTMFRVK